MRKVFVLFTGLFILSMFAACSEDTTPTPPAPPADLAITTAAVATGYTCSPYSMTIEVEGGVAPYTWSLEAGSSLPDGLVLSADGRVTGLCMITGAHTFTVRVEDSSETPKTAEREFTLSVEVPSNPSLAVFFDNQATVCSTGTASWTPLNCYVYIMLEESEVGCATACEFKLRLTDADGVDLDPGSEYAIIGTSTPSYVAVTLGDLFNGMAIAFNRPMYATEPILVASFNILLLEDLQDLSFKFEPNPGGYLAIASCEEGYPIVEVNGRAAAVNY
jgi:hypothetical protein